MNREELASLVKGGESEQVEFKGTTGQRSDAAKAVCALLDGRDGLVLFGVSGRGNLIGQQVAAHTLVQASQELRRSGPARLADIRAAVGHDVPVRTIQDDEQLLRLLDLVDTAGHSATARWLLKGAAPQASGR